MLLPVVGVSSIAATLLVPPKLIRIASASSCALRWSPTILNMSWASNCILTRVIWMGCPAILPPVNAINLSSWSSFFAWMWKPPCDSLIFRYRIPSVSMRSSMHSLVTSGMGWNFTQCLLSGFRCASLTIFSCQKMGSC